MYLLDTNILSEIIRKRRNERLGGSLRDHQAETLSTSCICVMELRAGAARTGSPTGLWGRIEREILSRVAVVDLGREEALLAGDVIAHLRSAGKPIDVEDVLIAATALVRGWTVVTHNTRHFERIPGLRLEDWIGS